MADRPLAERRQNWDRGARQRLAELERQWREQQILTIREELRDERATIVQPARKKISGAR